MTVIRVNKTTDYTVMSNTHLKEKGMSLKAKGLLSLMLSLPDSWDYSIVGLCAICKENETAIKSTLSELKLFGYLVITKKKPNETASGRYEYEYNIYENPQVYQAVEKMPEFPGGKQRLLDWVMKSIQYPAEAREMGIQGRVIVQFVVNKSGKAVEPVIVQSLHHLLDDEAIRLIESMPRWKPGEEKGEPVRVKFTMPINFRLSEGNKRR